MATADESYWRLQSELLVYGYCKAHSKSRIPDVVMDICTDHYHEKEFFEIAGKNVTISDGLTITKTHIENQNDIAREYWNTSYGALRIQSNESTIYRWKLQIRKGSTQYLTIGISSNDEHDKNYSAWRSDGGSYKEYEHYGVNGYMGHKTSIGGTESYGEGFQGGDTMEIVLDMDKAEISFYKNGKSPGVAFENVKKDVDLTYRLAVTLCKKNDSVTLTEFSRKYTDTKPTKDSKNQPEGAM